jgi:hypothetical protein
MLESINFTLIKDNISLATKIENISKIDLSLKNRGINLLKNFSEQQGKLAKRAKQILGKK